MAERPRLRAVARLITNSNCVGWAVLIRKLEHYGRVSETPAKAAPARAVVDMGREMGQEIANGGPIDDGGRGAPPNAASCARWACKNAGISTKGSLGS